MLKIKEIWKDVVGYEGLYQVSNLGRVKRINPVPQYILKSNFGANKYLCVTLRKNKKSRRIEIHRLVACAFLGKSKPKQEINHKSGIKADNDPENLEWVTHLENMQHIYYMLGAKILNPQRTKKGCPKLTNENVLVIRTLLDKTKLTQHQIGKMFDIGRSNISRIKSRRCWGYL